jgi:hypothetical protein
MKTNNSNGSKLRNKENIFVEMVDKKRINTIARFSGVIK